MTLDPVVPCEGQLSVFDTPHVRGSDTSTEAAHVLDATGRANRIRTQVLALFVAYPDGLTCWEVEDLTGGSHETISSAITTLRSPKYGREAILDSGRRKVRPSTNRRTAIYVLNPNPRQETR